MSKKRLASLHMEWSPGRVFAVDIATRRSANGETVSDVASVTSGNRDVVVGISRNAIFLKALYLPKAAPEDLRRLLAVQIGQIFPLPASQLAYDFHQTSEHGAEGYLTVVAAMRADDLRLLQSELQRANLKAVRIMPVTLGAGIIAARAGLSRALVIEQTGLGLALDIVQAGTVRFSRIAPPGSDPLQEARRTLTAFGVGEEPLVAAGKLEISGALARPETALELLDEVPWSGFELAEERVRVQQRRIAIQTRLALLLMLSALLLVGLVWVDRSDAQAVIKRGEGSWARELSKLRSIRDTELAKASLASERKTIVDRAFQPGQSLSDVARVIGDTLPGNSWLTGVTLERGKPIQVRGTTTAAEDVARYLNNMARVGRFRDVKLVFANSAKINETPVVQFSLTTTAIGNLPLPEPQKAKARRATGTSSSTSKQTEPKDSPQL